MGSLRLDIRAALRSLAARPGFTLASTLTLALAIGANSTVFSVIDAVLLKALPFPDPERLAMVWETVPDQGETEAFLSFPNYRDYAEGSGAFEGMAAFFARPNQNVNLTGGSEPERVNVARVTSTYFDVLGIAPALGRAFTDEEDRVGNHRVAILSHSLWTRQFRADAEIIGTSVYVNGFAYAVVGVMPAGFRPLGSMALGEEVDLWRPLAASAQQRGSRGWRDLRVVGRLRPGASIESANQALSVIAARIAEEEPDMQEGRGVRLVSLHEQSTGDVRGSLALLWGAVGLLLLIACANVANLQLVQASSRAREVSIRASLGATRGRITRLLLVESSLLAGLGATLGLLLAWAGISIVTFVAADQTSLLSRATLDIRVLGFTAFIAGATGLLFGAVPALRAGRVDLTTALKEAGSGNIRGWGASRYFVVVQIVMTMVLLVGSGLLLRSFSELRNVDAGFQPDGLLTFQLELPMVTRYPSQDERERFFAELLERVDGLRGVRSVATSTSVPMGDGGMASTFWIDGRPEPPAADRPTADVRLVSPSYFATMGIPLLRGRGPQETDVSGQPRIVAINRTMANRFFPGSNPVGESLQVDGIYAATIVGVVGDVRIAGLAQEPRPTIYYAAAQTAYNFMTVVVRTDGAGPGLAKRVRAQVAEMDPELPVHNIRGADELLADNVRSEAFTARLLSVFALLALTLAGVGTYGVMRSAVERRRRELGIRLALGARPSDAFGIVVRDGGTMVLTGVAIGLVLAAALSGAVSTVLYSVSPLDPVAYLASAAFLSVVGLTTVSATALSAARTNPNEPLRNG
jgi:putative ABC transport system permease protein